jgi:hypothetical protein
MKLGIDVSEPAMMCAIGVSAQAQRTREEEARTDRGKDGKKISLTDLSQRHGCPPRRGVWDRDTFQMSPHSVHRQ